MFILTYLYLWGPYQQLIHKNFLHSHKEEGGSLESLGCLFKEKRTDKVNTTY